MSKLIPVFLLTVVTAMLPVPGSAQAVFRSTQSANLPTARMLSGGNWLFEISHRFDSPISRGSDAFWGLDGPVRNRLGLTFGAHDRLMLSALRSNLADNVELNAKFGGFGIESDALPLELAAQGGVAWNTQVFPTEGATDNELQAYFQLIANVLVADRLAVGVVPTILRNPRILDVDKETAAVLGVNGQLYLNPTWSLLGEWIFSEAREDFANDGGTFGFEIRTSGHSFKLLVTNQSMMNPTQFLAGTANDFFDADDWRFGFNITRLLPF